MTKRDIPNVKDVPSKTGETRVDRHDITFQLRVTTFNGAAVNGDTSSTLHKALAVADEDMHSRLPREISNWRYVDHYKVECDRLEIFQPEFGYDDTQPEEVSLYDITVTAPRELPLNRADASHEHPVSVQQLVEEVPALLQSIYAGAGVSVELHKVSYFKQYQHSSKGTYIAG